MWSNGFQRTIELSRRQDPVLATGIAAAGLLFGGLIWLGLTPAALRWWALPAIALLTLSSIWTESCRRSPWFVRRVILDPDGGWRLQAGSAALQPAVLTHSWELPAVGVLAMRWRLQDGRRCRMLLFARAVPADTLRRLRVRLRFPVEVPAPDVKRITLRRVRMPPAARDRDRGAGR